MSNIDVQHPKLVGSCTGPLPQSDSYNLGDSLTAFVQLQTCRRPLSSCMKVPARHRPFRATDLTK
eukprot:545368-Amphidinium_carterae.1